MRDVERLMSLFVCPCRIRCRDGFVCERVDQVPSRAPRAAAPARQTVYVWQERA